MFKVKISQRRGVPSTCLATVSLLLLLICLSPFNVGYEGSEWGIRVGAGGIGLSIISPPRPNSPGFWFEQPSRYRLPSSIGELLPDYSQVHTGIDLPMWIPAFVACAALAIVAVRQPAFVSSDEARCACGYDLTGNTSGKCPECGRTL